MKTIYLLFLMVACGLTCAAQEAGNRQYGGANRRTVPSNGVIFGTENKDLVPAQYIEAYVLLNSAPDEFVAVFGVAQEGPTAAQSNNKVNTQLDQFLKAIAKLGIARGDTFVDLITQNRVYSFVPSADNSSIIQEKLTGFETKKTIAVRYKDRALLEKLLAEAAAVSIFDLIKVDYVINDMTKIRNRLFDEASRIIKQKEETYARALGIKLRRDAIYQEKYDTLYPAELYETYKAFESGTVDTNYDSRTRVVHERKSSTSYLEPLDRSAFDSVLTPIGIEPVVKPRCI